MIVCLRQAHSELAVVISKEQTTRPDCKSRMRSLSRFEVQKTEACSQMSLRSSDPSRLSHRSSRTENVMRERSRSSQSAAPANYSSNKHAEAAGESLISSPGRTGIVPVLAALSATSIPICGHPSADFWLWQPPCPVGSSGPPGKWRGPQRGSCVVIIPHFQSDHEHLHPALQQHENPGNPLDSGCRASFNT